MAEKKQVLEVEACGKVCVIKFKSKDIDMDENGVFYDEIKRLIQNGKIFILVDFSGVAYMSSLVIATLLSGLKNTKAKGGHFKLCCLSGKVLQTLEITQLNRVLEVYKTQQDALTKGNWEAVKNIIEFK